MKILIIDSNYNRYYHYDAEDIYIYIINICFDKKNVFDLMIVIIMYFVKLIIDSNFVIIIMMLKIYIYYQYLFLIIEKIIKKII